MASISIAQPGRVGDGGARHAREDHASEDVDVAEASGDVPADGRAKVKIGRSPQFIHEGPGEEKEGNGQKRKGVKPPVMFGG